MNGPKLEFGAYKDIRTRKIEVALYSVEGSGHITHMAKIVMEPYDYEAKTEPMIRLSPEQAQQLMDELWGQNVRPTDVGTPGELGAVKYHLEDMRKLVFNGR